MFHGVVSRNIEPAISYRIQPMKRIEPVLMVVREGSCGLARIAVDPIRI